VLEEWDVLEEPIELDVLEGAVELVCVVLEFVGTSGTELELDDVEVFCDELCDETVLLLLVDPATL
jgi:hypothetical protein